MGSGYIAANYSSQYKVTKVLMYQKVPETVYLNVTEAGGCQDKGDECFSKNLALFEKGVSNMGAKKTISVSNHFAEMEYTLYTDHGVLLTGKAEFLKGQKLGEDTAESKKIALVFKYDKSGILSLHRAEALVKQPGEDTKEESFAMKVKSKLHGPQPMSKAEKKEAKELIE